MNDKDLIRREDALRYAESIRQYLNELYSNGRLKISDVDWRALMEVILSVGDIPAVDAKPVVLCKDCKHYNNGWCYNPNTYDDEKTRGNTVPDWYCADGERREVNDER
jgi:hypothetical protein